MEGWETPPNWSVSKLKCFSPCISLPPSSARPHRWNQLDLAIVLLSVMGITLEEIEINAALAHQQHHHPNHAGPAHRPG